MTENLGKIEFDEQRKGFFFHRHLSNYNHVYKIKKNNNN